MRRLGCFWTKTRSTLALPIWHCRGTFYGSLEQNYLFVPPSTVVQAWDLVIPKPVPPTFVFQKIGNQVQIFDTFDRGFNTADKLFAFVPPSTVVQAWDLVIPKPVPPAFVFRKWETKFKFSTLLIRVSIRLTNYSHWDSCLRLLMWTKNSQMFIRTKTGDYNWLGPSPNQCGPPVWKKSQVEDAESGADIKIRERY